LPDPLQSGIAVGLDHSVTHRVPCMDFPFCETLRTHGWLFVGLYSHQGVLLQPLAPAVRERIELATAMMGFPRGRDGVESRGGASARPASGLPDSAISDSARQSAPVFGEPDLTARGHLRDGGAGCCHPGSVPDVSGNLRATGPAA
jgi:hypothetical protein